MYGNPAQTMVHTINELNKLASMNSTVNDKNYCSTCFFSSDMVTPVFHDLFFENDNVDVTPIRKISEWYTDHSIPHYIVFSGRGGFHIHAIFQPVQTTHQTIKNLASLVLSQTDTQALIDPHVVGDVRRLCRIPNTKRVSSGYWCVPITKKELFSIDRSQDFLELSKAPRYPDIFDENTPRSIFEFVDEAPDPEIDLSDESSSYAPPTDFVHSIQNTRHNFSMIPVILRPCVLENIVKANPKHIFRLSATLELMHFNYTDEEIFDFFASLHWIDFAPDFTRYQIRTLRRKADTVRPPGKTKLNCTKNITCIECILRK